MLAVHLSDLHLSRYGEMGLWSEREEREPWEVVHTWQRWQIEGLRDRRERPEKLRLVDPSGVIHKQQSWPRKKDDRAVGGLLSLAMERHLTSAEKLIGDRPGSEDLAALLRIDPRNTNLLFLRLLDDILPLDPDLILITGDVTDSGFGYGLVEHCLAPWIERGRLLVVPGNHDTYDMYPRKGRRARALAREERYRSFARKVGMADNANGAWFHLVDDVAIVGLNSCKAPLTPLSASGEVSVAQLEWLGSLPGEADFAGARLRIGLVHHHLLRMPFEPGKRGPIEVGLKLRNAPEVMSVCRRAGFDILLNGHRHHGYVVQLAGHPMVVSSPSSTLGCKSTDMEYVWLLELTAQRPFPMLHELTNLAGTSQASIRTKKGRGRSRP